MTISDHERVINAVEEQFYEHGKLSKKSDIEVRTGLSSHKVGNIIEDLLGGQLVEIYEGSGDPTIYATIQMFNAITSHVGEPEWIEDYEFEGKRELRDDVREANDKISNYQVLELMLHAQGTPLEDGIEKGLKILGFDPERTEDEEDFFFEDDGTFFVAEAKGKGGQISKSDINQLNGWVESKLDQEYSASDLNGVLFHNAHRDVPPSERDPPLTGHASDYLELYNFRHMSTYDLFLMVKEIEEFDGSTEDREDLVSEVRDRLLGAIEND